MIPQMPAGAAAIRPAEPPEPRASRVDPYRSGTRPVGVLYSAPPGGGDTAERTTPAGPASGMAARRSRRRWRAGLLTAAGAGPRFSATARTRKARNVRIAAVLGRAVAAALFGALVFAACAPAAAPPAKPAAAAAPPAKPAAAAAGGAAGATAAPSAAAAAAPRAAELPTTPVVDLKVGVLAVASWGPLFVAQDRGYFKDLGLNVEFVNGQTVNEHIAPLAQGQLQVAGCASNVPCFNALNRRTDLQIVADVAGSGKTEKSRGGYALVVRKDLWDAGTIRTAGDLVGRTVYLQAGEGSAPYVQMATWLIRQGIDPHSVDVANMFFPDVYAAMLNKGIEVGYQSEPLLRMGLANGTYEVLATIEEMHPTTETLYLLFWSGIERMGPKVGERFIAAYLRGVRDYINAFEYGEDQDAIIEILVRETPLKDPNLYRQIRYTWVDPNGVFRPEALEADAALLHDVGLMQPIDLRPMFDDHYRQAAVEYLGEYHPPR
jgi:NitT/TauT family transport system substrate-binding protein